MQTMYNLPMPVATIRTRIRQEFERHRYVAKLPVTDVLLFKSHAEYQVCGEFPRDGYQQLLTADLGDDELLEADYPRDVILQGGKLQRRQETAIKLHDRISRGPQLKQQIACSIVHTMQYTLKEQP
jgi:hypothetical protein